MNINNHNYQSFLLLYADGELLPNEMEIVDAFVKSGFLSSGNETRRALKENAVSVNKVKVTEEYVISTNDLIANTFVLLQKGKKNYYILKVV